MTDELQKQADQVYAIDVLAELVDEKYPKGTQDPYGKSLRHQLHKLGRLNEPSKPERDEAAAQLFELAADVVRINKGERGDYNSRLRVLAAKAVWETCGAGDINRAVDRKFKTGRASHDKLSELVHLAAPGATNASPLKSRS